MAWQRTRSSSRPPRRACRSSRRRPCSTHCSRPGLRFHGDYPRVARGAHRRLHGRCGAGSERASGASTRPTTGPSACSRRGRMKARVLFVSRERFRLPLEGAQARKWEAVAGVVEQRVLAAAPAGSPTRDERFHLVGRARCSTGRSTTPAAVADRARAPRLPPDAALVQGVHETVAFLVARAIARVPTKVVLDVQGDWHEATRLYGSRWRRLLNPVNDALGRPCEEPTRCARSRRRRPGSCARSASSRPRCSRRTSMPTRSSRGRRCRCRSGLGPSSSACSSATRPSTRSPTPGGSRHRRCRTRCCTSSATARCAIEPQGSSESSRGRRSGRGG